MMKSKNILGIVNILNGKKLCKYCYFNDECEGEIKSVPGGSPDYPACFYGLEENDFDLDAYLDDKDEEEQAIRNLIKELEETKLKEAADTIILLDKQNEDMNKLIHKLLHVTYKEINREERK